ncbi:MAG: TonB-dependent receptor [Rikenellaceae bacterium]|jgi:TonB-linked SusC/RagA family outer membrane protein|nr:TonB-dependent receptor [Rikenellaceae bacterium]
MLKNPLLNFGRPVFFLLLAVCCAGALSAQTRRVTGTVTDDQNQPVTGATVMVKGTTNGTTTNVQGGYALTNVPAGATTLEVSFLGMETREVPISGDVVNITLNSGAFGLDEVVVVGYGTQRKRDLTGAVAAVGGTELTKIPITSAAQALAGKVAGVSVMASEGSPDAEIKIRIRGGGSITQDNSPLYVVDGFPVNDFNNIAMGDIESMTILKDASSTAIYGARGANGVVLITTKQGQAGRINVSLNAYTGVRKIAKTLDVLSPYDYVLWQYELANETGQQADAVKRFYGDYEDYELYQNQQGTNWQDEVFGRTAAVRNYSVNVSGGNDRTRFSIGLSRADEEGIMIHSGMQRNTASLNLNTKINDHWSVDFITRYTNYIVDGNGTSSTNSTSSFLRHAIQYAPTNGIADMLDEIPVGPDIDSYSLLINPVKVADQTYRKNIRNTFTINGAVNFKFLDHFTARSELGADVYNNRNDQYYGSETPFSMQNGGYPIVNLAHTNGDSYRIANTLTYERRDITGGHSVTVMLGQEATSTRSKQQRDDIRYFPMGVGREEALAMLNQGKPEPVYSYHSPDNNMLSYFGRANYSYRDRYLVSATFRADGSSKFAKDNRWGYFPSVAVAWRLSEEEFIKDATQSWLSNAKFRLSWGKAGNNRIADDLWKMIWYSSLDGKPVTSGGGGSETILNQLRPGSMLNNPGLKWETTVTRNVGLDLGFFGGRLNAVVDFYYNTTKDLLIQAAIPSSTGYTAQMRNIGQTSNRGLEISLDGVIIDKRDFMLSAAFNIAFNRNKVDKLGDSKSLKYTSGWFGVQFPTNDYLLEEGKETGLMYGYVTDGMYGFDDFNYDPAAGVYSLKEGVADCSGLFGTGRWFGPGTIKIRNFDDNPAIGENDKRILGSANPKHTGGFSLNAIWKGIDLSAQFNWVYGNNVYNANKLNFSSYPQTRTFQNMMGFMRWGEYFTTVDRDGLFGTPGAFISDPDQLKQLNADATYWSPMHSTFQLHSWAIEDGSFLRLNNLTLGYTLPKKWLDKIKVPQIRLYASGYNLYTWTNYTGYDPEVDVYSHNPLTPNVDYSAYPRSRTFVGGINITF